MNCSQQRKNYCKHSENTMKQTLDQEQTQRLIELGLPKPKTISQIKWNIVGRCSNIQCSYSVGELLEILEECVYVSIDRFKGEHWSAEASPEKAVCPTYLEEQNMELADALYEMILKYKTSNSTKK